MPLLDLTVELLCHLLNLIQVGLPLGPVGVTMDLCGSSVGPCWTLLWDRRRLYWTLN